MGPQQETKLNSIDFNWVDDSFNLDMIQFLTEADGVTMSAAKPVLSSPSPTPTTLARSSIPLNYPRMISQQGGRWLYFQAFETEHFEFLINFTSNDGLDSTFNFLTSLEKGSDGWHFDDLLTIDDLLDIDYDFGSRQIKDAEKPSRASRTMDWLFDPLLPQTKAICEKLLRLPGIDGGVTDDYTQSLDEECLEFFNPLNLRRLLDTYWKRWHRNCPIIHPPSFDHTQAPIELIIVMVLTGACVSTDPQDAVNARKWLDSAEGLIFALPWLSRESDSNQIDLSLTRVTKLRFLQTAILMCVLQTWEGSDKAKARVRKLRYPYVAQAAQELVYCQPGEQIGADLAATIQHWDEFIIGEQLIRYEAIDSPNVHFSLPMSGY